MFIFKISIDMVSLDPLNLNSTAKKLRPDTNTRIKNVDRGMMGDGVIDIHWIRNLVEATGYNGFHEVEIFSERNWWRRNPDEVVKIAKKRYLQFV